MESNVATLWGGTVAPPRVLNALSMLTPGERSLLYRSTRHYFNDHGAIIDAGCFVGGSTMALAAGLDDRGAPSDQMVQSFDLFEALEFQRDIYLKPAGYDLIDGRFRHVFDKITASVASRVCVHDGDITATPWGGGDIAILFLDVCKNWKINDYVTNNYFPKLIPGYSLIFQQDYFYCYGFWIVATMELFSEYFEHLGDEMWDTAVFRLKRSIPHSEIPTDLRDLGLEKLSALVKRSEDRQTDPLSKTRLKISRAVLHRDFGDEAMAIGLAREAQSESEHWLVKLGLQDSGLWSSDLDTTGELS